MCDDDGVGVFEVDKSENLAPIIRDTRERESDPPTGVEPVTPAAMLASSWVVSSLVGDQDRLFLLLKDDATPTDSISSADAYSVDEGVNMKDGMLVPVCIMERLCNDSTYQWKGN